MTTKQKTRTAADLDLEAAELAQQTEAQEKEQAQRQAAVRVWEDDRAGRYLADYGGRIKAAWNAFVEAVADGGDVHAAWIHYRATRRIVAAEYGANHGVLARREIAVYDAVMAEFGWLQEESMRIGDQTSNGTLGGRTRSERLAAWNARLAAFEGVDRDPADPLRPVAYPGLRDPHGRIVYGGPDPREGESFAKAFDQAVAEAEKRALDTWRADRKAERDAHVKAAKR